MKCVICKHAEREASWQPFGPGNTPLSFSAPGSHARGFPVVAVCNFCRHEKIEAGQVVLFRYKGIEYRFCSDDDMIPVATSLWDGGEATPINGQGAPNAIMLCRDKPRGHDIVALVEGRRLADLFTRAPRLERSHDALRDALHEAIRTLERYDSTTARRLMGVLLENA